MILKTRYGGDREVRAAEWGTAHHIPPPWYGNLAASGHVVTTDNAAGLPAVGRAIRLVGGLIGVALLSVFVGRGGDRRELPDHPNADLFRNPYPGVDEFRWRYDIAVSLEVAENAFIRKIKTGRGRVVALEVIPPRYVNARVDRNGDKRYEIQTAEGFKQVDPAEILHIRGQTVDGGPFGVSRLMQHRDPVGAMIAAQRFEGSYFRNHARPDVAFVFPEQVLGDKGQQYKAEIQAEYGGAENFGKPIVVGGGLQVVPIPISLRDAQFIEAKGMGVADVARIMDVEELLLGGGSFEQQDQQAMDRFLAFQMPPRLARIASALKADPDLFAGKPEYPDFKADPLMFASPLTRANVQHKQIQAGTLLPDEARADNGRPPLPPLPEDPAQTPGKIPQIVPVGGSPFGVPDPASDPNDQEEEPAE